MTWLYIKFFASLMVVLGAIWIFVQILQTVQKKKFSLNRRLKLEEVLALDMGTKIYLIRCDDTEYLMVAGNPKHCSVLHVTPLVAKEKS
jgi:flagellar biogenesis protein FliO